jgi:hypothetical protein
MQISDEQLKVINDFVCQAVVELHESQAARLFEEALVLVTMGFSVDELVVYLDKNEKRAKATVEIRANFPAD